MAKEVKLTITLDDHGTFKKVIVNTEELVHCIKSVQEESEKTKKSIISWAEASQAADILQNSISELQSVVSDLTSAWRVQVVAETQLQTIMRQRMNATDSEIQSIKDLCSAQQQLGVIGDEVQLSGAQQMATFLQNKQSLDVLIPAMNNLVAQQNGLNATNQDAVSIGNMMGKAMQGQVEVLQRVGITFDEAQKKVLQFGTESERAAMLAQVITNNVGDMNSELAKTETGKQKQLENDLGDIKEQLGEMLEGLEPTITYLAQLSMAATGVGKLTSSFIACAKALGVARLAAELWNVVCVRMKALITVCSATMQGAAVGATTLKVAIQGLMVATGVGVAIAALTTIIGYLITKSDEADSSLQKLTETEQRTKQAHQQEAQQMASVRSELEMNILTLRNFKGCKEQEKTLVQQMNSKYGEALGYYSTVDQWYTALTTNSKAYCNQMINEIRLRTLANQAADLMQQQRDVKYGKDGKIKKYSKKREKKTITHVGGSDPNNPEITTETVEVKGSSEWEKASQKLTKLYRQEQDVRKEMQNIINDSNKNTFKLIPGGSKTPPPAINTTPSTTTTPSTEIDEDPLKGSIDDYEKQISDLRKSISASANENEASRMQKELEIKEQELKDLKIRIGIEKPEPKEVKSRLEEMQDLLSAEQHNFDNAATIDAKIKISTNIAKLQAQIDEETFGNITISANVQPTYVKKGSIEDKRQSYTNAEGRLGRIKRDYEIGLIGKADAEKQVKELNTELADLGLKPIKFSIDVERGGFDKAMADIRNTWGNVEGVGSGIVGMTEALDGNKSAWERISGVINSTLQIAEGISGIVKLIDMLTTSTEAETAATAVNTTITAANTGVSATNTAAKSGEAVANATASGAKLPFPANLVAIAAGVAAVVGALGMISGAFADGGIVGGSSWTGDKLMARVNSGEMILNGAQQSRLFAIANGATVYGAASGVGRGSVEGVKVIPATERLQAMVVKDSENRFGGISLRLRGSDLVGVIANETRGNRRRSNIRI